MSLADQLVDGFYRNLVSTILRPIRNQAFNSTRRAKISATEQEALSSGSVGFEQEILSGHPDWQRLLSIEQASLSEVEQAFLEGPVEELCAILNDWEIRTKIRDLPPEIWDFMKKKGFFGMIISTEYGGLGFSAKAHSAVIMKLASRCTTACVTAMVPNSLGPAELLMHYGTPEQKLHYLPRLARGEEVPAFALTEPEAGSDAGSMTSEGVIEERDGQIGIRVSWDKRYITLSSIATLLGVAFKLLDPDGLLGKQKDRGITLALIPTSTPGISVGRRHDPLGTPFQNGPTTGKNVWIPLEAIIGGKAYAGQGWRMLMECLAVGRCISLPALSTGSAKLVCRMTGAYSRIRKQFKTPIGQFEGVEELLARMAGNTYMMDAARTTTLQMLDNGEQPTILSAILKCHLTEHGRKIVNDGMDILGGKAICEGPENLISPLYHGIPIGITVEGANLLTRSMIIFGQGSVRSHPYLLRELESARLSDPHEAMAAFTEWMSRHVRNTTNNGIRTLFYGLFDGWGSPTPKGFGSMTHYFEHMNRLSAAYALMADILLMLLGDSIKRKERLSALLGDILSHLYLTACVLRQFKVNGSLAEEESMVHWCCQNGLHQTEESLLRLIRNFPIPTLRPWLGGLMFPKGRRIQPPSHRLEHLIAKQLTTPGQVRDRLTAGIYLPIRDEEPLAKLDQCLNLVVEAEPLTLVLRRAIKAAGDTIGDIAFKTLENRLSWAVQKEILTESQATLMHQAEQLTQAVIRVDDFDQHWDMPEEALPVKKPALADGLSLKALYPTGLSWHLNIPHLDLFQMMEISFAEHRAAHCIDFLGKKYTYGELDHLIRKAAVGLQHRGVKPGDHVGLLMLNTPYYPILFLAILKLGAVVVNLCPMQTTDEIKAQIMDSGLRIVATLDLDELLGKMEHVHEQGFLDEIIVCPMAEVLPFFKAHAYRFLKSSKSANHKKLPTEGHADFKVLFKTLLETGMAALPDVKDIYRPDPNSLAVLQYTGGTTGILKGAQLTHNNLVANILQMEAFYQVTANKPTSNALIRHGQERVLSTIPYFHIFGMTVGMMLGLKMGNELLILPDPRNINQTLKTLRDKRPSVFPAIPRLLQALCENPRVTPADLSLLKVVISGGAALPLTLKAHFETVTGREGLLKQGYGLTEASPVVACNPPYGLNKAGSVGIALPQTEIKITHPDYPDQTLGIGEIGEICVRGPQIMQGYYGQEAETQGVLCHGWLRTGDLGYLDEDYYLFIVDRRKRMVLINGLNVYPAAIEQVLLQHPAIAECMVISVPDSRSGEAAKALIRLKSKVENPPSLQDVHLFLEERLSKVEVPKYMEWITMELPKTSVGKPDWKLMQDREKLKHLAH